jgi:hypothetical protein
MHRKGLNGMKELTRSAHVRLLFVSFMILQMLASFMTIQPVKGVKMEYFPMAPGNTLKYQSNNTMLESWQTKRYVDQEGEYLGGIFGTYTIHWCEARKNQNETDFTWVNQMWISKTEDTLMWHGFENKKSKTMADSPLAYVSEPIVLGAVHAGQTTLTVTMKATGETISASIAANYTIDAIETVSTPAGTFSDCIKVHEQENTPDGAVSFWVWYAPNIGAIKYYYPQQDGRYDVLISYQVDVNNDPWDLWLMPHLPLLIGIIIVCVGVLVGIVILVKIIKKKQVQRVKPTTN